MAAVTTPFGFGAVHGAGAPELVVVHAGRVRPLAVLLDAEVPGTVRELLPAWDDWVARVGAALESAVGVDGWTDQDEVSFAPPLDDPSSVFCAGANFYDHIIEMKVEAPDKESDQIFHPNAPPASAADALDSVAGYTVANDISIREPPIFGVRWVPSKGQDSMKPIRPAIVPRALVGDPANLTLSPHVNGVVRQQSNTDQMSPGDLISTGTPGGTANGHGVFLEDGDEMVATVEGVGTLVNHVAPTRA